MSLGHGRDSAAAPSDIGHLSPAEIPRRKYTCMFCDYKSKRPDWLAKHMETKHAGMRARVPQTLLDVVENQESAADVLRAVADWLQTNLGADGALKPEVVAQIKREDARIQLALRLIAAFNINNAFSSEKKMAELERFMWAKLNERKFKREAQPQELLGLLERLQDLQQKRLRFLGEIAELGEVNFPALIDRLTRAISESAKPVSMTGGSMASAGAFVPARADQRERLRRTARAVLLEVQEDRELSPEA